ncbi:matrixin family metalloprotease [Brevibacillus dissolubilis]|uniref:matrixin family metalloprotease n=1 Tax=Brevibacillus dissolubilis TaxID=1844116 RepID=UPI0011161332|nr:matrixin family metalloprotease [Brevibacillus dissolubilis]
MKTNRQTAFTKASLLCITLLAVSTQSAYANVTPTVGKWSTNSKSAQNQTNNSTDAAAYSTGKTRWNNSTDFLIGSTTSTSTFTYSNVYNSSATWDGICYYTWSGGYISGARTYLNNYFTDSYTSSLRNSVATHELGHAIGLDHNTTASQSSSVMTPYTKVSGVARTEYPQSYDITAVNNLYAYGFAGVQSDSTIPETTATGQTIVEVCFSWAEGYNTLEDLYKAADVVVKAKLAKTNSLTNKTGSLEGIATENSLKVQKTLKGNATLTDEQITVVTEIGESSKFQVVSDQLSPLQLNGTFYLFLKDRGDGTYALINGDEGVVSKKDGKAYKHVKYGELSEDQLEQLK